MQLDCVSCGRNVWQNQLELRGFFGADYKKRNVEQDETAPVDNKILQVSINLSRQLIEMDLHRQST